MSNARLYIVTFVVSLNQLISGLYVAWARPMLSRLLAKDPTVKITLDDARWLVSLLHLGCAIGAIAFMFLVDIVGRKISILLIIVPGLTSWTLLAFSSNVMSLYMVRLAGGIGIGATSTVGPIYLSEVATARLRGALTSCSSVLVNFGNVMGYVLASYVHMEEYAYVGAGLSVIQVVAFAWFPETPYYLLRRERHEAAMHSLIFFRGAKEAAQEINSVVRSVESNPRKAGMCSNILDLISDPAGKRLVGIAAGLMAIRSFSGAPMLFNYAQIIFNDIHTSTYLNKTHMTIILLTMYLVSTLICISYIDNWGRRPLLICSSIGITICTFALGTYFFLLQNGYEVEGSNWLAISAVYLYIVSLAIGLYSVPIVLVNEIFPMHVKDVCVGICICLSFLLTFGLLNVWSVIAYCLNTYTAFWFITVLNVLSIFIIVRYVPEIKNKTFEEIQKSFDCMTRR